LMCTSTSTTGTLPGAYGWLQPSSKILYQDYMPERLRPEIQKCSISKTIVVQAAPTAAETNFLLDLCEKEESLAGVVGWLDLDSDNFEQQLLQWKDNKYFVGLRPKFRDLDQDAASIESKAMRSLEMMGEYNIALDLLIRPHHLPFVLRLLDKMPHLKAVVNHLANPNYNDQSMGLWKRHMQEIAQYPNIYCKLSGMVNHIKGRAWAAADFMPHVHHIVNVFGFSRVMFGNDWPVCLRSAEYDQTVELLNNVLPSSLNEEERAHVFGLNAISYYGLAISE
jgi:L-fuconolactonase